MSDRRQRFETLALPHLDAAYNLARWLSRSPSEAEDVVQDAMLRAVRGFDGLRREEDVRPWLMSIVRNCWRDRVQQARRRPHVPLPVGALGPELVPELVYEGLDAEAQAIRASEARRLRATMAALPDEFREVLILREMEDLSYREIAEMVGIPIGTVMSRLARARALLKDKWIAATNLRGDAS